MYPRTPAQAATLLFASIALVALVYGPMWGVVTYTIHWLLRLFFIILEYVLDLLFWAGPVPCAVIGTYTVFKPQSISDWVGALCASAGFLVIFFLGHMSWFVAGIILAVAACTFGTVTAEIGGKKTEIPKLNTHTWISVVALIVGALDYLDAYSDQKVGVSVLVLLMLFSHLPIYIAAVIRFVLTPVAEFSCKLRKGRAEPPVT
jgi:hypothetical protein